MLADGDRHESDFYARESQALRALMLLRRPTPDWQCKKCSEWRIESAS